MAGEIKNCKRCNTEFTAKRSNQVYCSGMCSRFSRYRVDPIYGGRVQKKGNKIIVTGAINCMMFMNGMLDV